MLEKLEKTIVEVVDKVLPSVVSVSTTRLARIDLFRVAPVQGQGSGVIVKENGIVITNAHVVQGAKELEVGIGEGQSFQAEVLGQAREQDIAVLKIDKEGLTPIQVGSSSSLKVGQFAIAVGNPLGLGESVTFGMISAVNRTIGDRSFHLGGLIQTTAQINPGNSGGALVNTSGELIGIPTAMIPFSQGIGFAIAVDTIKDIWEDIVQTGAVSPPWLGVVGYTITKQIAAYYRLPVEKGALIVQIPYGPARESGLRPGDIIVALDNEEVDGIENLGQKIVKRRIGDKVKVRFYRGDNALEIDAKLTRAPQ